MFLLIVNIVHLLTAVQSQAGQERSDMDYRLGLLGPSLGLDPTGGFLRDESEEYDESEYFDSEPLASLIDPFIDSQQCCCVPVNQLCPDPFGSNSDLISLGVVNSTSSAGQLDMDLQDGLVFRFAPLELISSTDCPESLRSCCYDADIDLESFAVSCLSPEQSQAENKSDSWVPGCEETDHQDMCGQRNFSDFLSKSNDESSPGEFPWTCLILNAQNGFVGNCVLIPDEADSGKSRKVLTAAHKLNFVNSSDLKVRLGEFDASAFKTPETEIHIEIEVESIIKHPLFSPKRLSHDAAVLTLSRSVDISGGNLNINAPCFPSCAEQFSHLFENKTGSNCWLSGWSVDRESLAFRPVQHKVMVSLMAHQTCQQTLTDFLSAREPALADLFSLDPSEVCAGQGPHQDVCQTEEGAPLVCQSQSGRWTLVGMMTWTLGCNGGAGETPGVFLNIANVLDWIVSIH